MHFVREIRFACEMRFAREKADTSLCAQGAIHHYGEAITSLRQRRNITKKFPLALPTNLWYNERKKGGEISEIQKRTRTEQKIENTY